MRTSSSWNYSSVGKEVLSLSRELIRIPSMYFREHEISRFVCGKLRDWGLSPKYVNIPGHGPDAVAEAGGNHFPAIVLSGHIDTIMVNRERGSSPCEIPLD